MSNEKKGTAPDVGTGPDTGTVTLSVADFAELESQKGRMMELAAKVAELETREAEHQARAERAELDAFIAEASEAGKLPPSLHAWARSIKRAELEAFVANAPVYTPPAAQSPRGSAAGVALTDEDRQIAKMTGVSIDDVIKTRKAELTAEKDAN